jgi:hypothetical protein
MDMDQDYIAASMSKPERVSSRLIKKERSKLLKQTIWLVGGGVILVIGFIFLILPNFINVVNSVLSTNPIPEEEAVIIQPPELVAPVSATFSAQLTVRGVSTTGMKTVLVVNGQQGSVVDPDATGSFSASVDLTEGENSVVAFAKDEKGNESKTSRPYIIMLDTTKPLLELSEPQDTQEFDSKQSTVTVAGKSEPNTKIYLNDRFFLPKADGSFSTTLSLNQGENKFTVRAVDQAGNQVELVRTVKRK